MTQNQIAYQAHLENQRANKARETETHRSNIANEEETKRSNIAREAETNRSNVAREIETNRSNLAKETETNRSNLANEMLKATEIETKSRDTRYTADVGYQGRVDTAYISKWGVSPTDVSSLASTIGGGIRKAAPGAIGVAQAGLGLGNRLATHVATAPVRAVVNTATQIRKGVNKIVQPSNKSTNSGRTTQTRNNNKIGGHNNVKKKNIKQQKY